MSEEEDDYMNFAVAEPKPTKIETSIQRRARLKREAEERARPKSKAQIRADEEAARAAALATSIDSDNKGFRMMAKMGFKGGALGKEGEGRVDPVSLAMKEDRSGIGLESEKKRKFREEMEKREIDTKKAKVDEGDYRERMRLEREEKRFESQIIGAMKVSEKLDEDESNATTTEAKTEEQAQDAADASEADVIASAKSNKTENRKPLSSINVLWRGTVKHRREKERARRMRYDLHQSLSKLPTYDDPDEDEQYKHALGTEEEELEEEDPELDEFNALEPAIRLGKLVEYLRERHHYCFWCKHQYPDATMEGCPGLTEDDHD